LGAPIVAFPSVRAFRQDQRALCPYRNGHGQKLRSRQVNLSAVTIVPRPSSDLLRPPPPPACLIHPAPRESPSAPVPRSLASPEGGRPTAGPAWPAAPRPVAWFPALAIP